MPKAIISNRIYMHVPPEGPEALMQALTYKIEQKAGGRNGKFKAVEVICNYKIVKENVISIPQGRLDLIPDDYEIDDRRVLHEVPFPKPTLELREGQELIFNQANDTCFLNALVGWGKTFWALHMARKLGQKTLVVTHTTMLRDQWIEEIKTLFDIEPGIIGSGKFDIEDHCIVVGNVQTVTKVLPKISKEFGLVILDEAHHCPATTFSSIIDGMHARYRIGLSGTVLRKDGKHIIFRDYFGSTVYKPAQSHTLNPTIKLVKTGVQLEGDGWAKKINNLLYDNDYQEFIVTLAKLQIAKGHKVLIVASRVEFLEKVKELIGDCCVLITGATSFEERNELISKVENGEANAIAGSRQIFTEGISVNPLSCLILAEPTSNEILLEQLIGRIMRLYVGKLVPLVIDLQFKGAESSQNNKRLAFYYHKNWEVEMV